MQVKVFTYPAVASLTRHIHTTNLSRHGCKVITPTVFGDSQTFYLAAMEHLLCFCGKCHKTVFDGLLWNDVSQMSPSRITTTEIPHPELHLSFYEDLKLVIFDWETAKAPQIWCNSSLKLVMCYFSGVWDQQRVYVCKGKIFPAAVSCKVLQSALLLVDYGRGSITTAWTSNA